MDITEGNRTPKGYQQITSLASVQTLSPPSGARMAIIQAESQGVRWRDDGTNPTGTVGMLIASGDALIYVGDLSAIKLIQAAGGAVANIAYYL